MEIDMTYRVEHIFDQYYSVKLGDNDVTRDLLREYFDDHDTSHLVFKYVAQELCDLANGVK